MDGYVKDFIENLQSIAKYNLASNSCKDDDFMQIEQMKRKFIAKTIENLKSIFSSIKILDLFKIFSTNNL